MEAVREAAGLDTDETLVPKHRFHRWAAAIVLMAKVCYCLLYYRVGLGCYPVPVAESWGRIARPVDWGAGEALLSAVVLISVAVSEPVAFL